MKENDQPFPQEVPAQQRRLWQSDNTEVVAQLVAHQHLGLDAMIIQCVHQAVSRHSSTARLFARINYQYPHSYCSFALRFASLAAFFS